MNYRTEQSVRFAAQQAGIHYFLRNVNFGARLIKTIAIWLFLLGTALVEVLHWSHHR